MTCETLMDPSLPALHTGDPAERAVELLLQHRLPALPVVDESGRYRGLIGICGLLGQLLPRAATLGDRLGDKPGDALPDLSYMSESVQDVRERYAALRGRRVEELVDAKATVVPPGTPLMETLWILYRSQTVLPVVEAGSGRLLGAVSSRSALAAVTESP